MILNLGQKDISYSKSKLYICALFLFPMAEEKPKSPFQSRTSPQANPYPSQQNQTAAVQPPANTVMPSGGAQPAQQPGQMPAKKKGSWKIWVIVIAVLIIAAGLGVYFLVL